MNIRGLYSLNRHGSLEAESIIASSLLWPRITPLHSSHLLPLPLSRWPPNELLYFPKALHPYFPPGSQATLPDHKQRLLKRVEDEYRRWRSESAVLRRRGCVFMSTSHCVMLYVGAARGSEAELVRQFRETDSSEYLLW